MADLQILNPKTNPAPPTAEYSKAVLPSSTEYQKHPVALAEKSARNPADHPYFEASLARFVFNRMSVDILKAVDNDLNILKKADKFLEKTARSIDNDLSHNRFPEIEIKDKELFKYGEGMAPFITGLGNPNLTPPEADRLINGLFNYIDTQRQEIQVKGSKGQYYVQSLQDRYNIGKQLMASHKYDEAKKLFETLINEQKPQGLDPNNYVRKAIVALKKAEEHPENINTIKGETSFIDRIPLK